MKKLATIFVALATLATPLSALAAAGPQIFMFGTPSQRSTSAGAVAINGRVAVAAANNTAIIAGAAGTFSNMYCYSDNALTGAQTWTYAIVLNGVTKSISCVVNSSGSGSDTSHTVAVVAGEQIYLSLTAANTPNTSNVYGHVQFTPTSAGDELMGADPGGSLGATNTYGFGNLVTNNYDSVVTVVSNRVQDFFPDAGTMSNFYINTNTAPGAAKDRLFSVWKNAATTTLAVDIADVLKAANDTTDTVSISANDLMSLNIYSTSTPASGNYAWGAKFVPTTSGDHFLFAHCGNSDSTTVEQYHSISGSGTGGTTCATAVIASSTMYADTMTLTKLNVTDMTLPGSTKTRVFTLMVNSATSSPIVTCTDSNTGSCSWSGSFAVTRGQTLSIADQPTGGAAATRVSFTTTFNTNTGVATAPAVGGKHKLWSGFLRIIGGFFNFR